jgi:hypothetical protein
MKVVLKEVSNTIYSAALESTSLTMSLDVKNQAFYATFLIQKYRLLIHGFKLMSLSRMFIVQEQNTTDPANTVIHVDMLIQLPAFFTALFPTHLPLQLVSEEVSAQPAAVDLTYAPRPPSNKVYEPDVVGRMSRRYLGGNPRNFSTLAIVWRTMTVGIAKFKSYSLDRII